MKKLIIETVKVTKKTIEIYVKEDGLTENEAEKIVSLSGQTIPSQSGDYDYIHSLINLDDESEDQSCLFDLRARIIQE